MKKTVYLVRHGESEANISPYFQGPDSPLSEKGKEQAERIAERASHLPIELVVASTMKRAFETAEYIKQATQKEIVSSDLFVERGKPTAVFNKPHSDKEASELFRKWEESLFTSGMRVEDGENFDDLKTRAGQALTFLVSRSEEQILVATHGFFMRTLAAHVLFGDALTGDAFRNLATRMTTQNSGISILSYDTENAESSWKMLVWNDHAHLG